MDPIVIALARNGPRYVSEYMVLFRGALSSQFDIDYPGRTENVYLLSNLYVGPLNKRHVVFYVGVGNTRDTVTQVTRVDYTLPLSPGAASAFGIHTVVPVPHEGPDFTNIPLEGRTAQAAVASDIAILVAAADPRNRIALWNAEIARVQGVFDDAVVGSDMKKKAGKLLQFWRDMYEKVDIEIARLYILDAATRTPRARALRIRARTRRAAEARATNVPMGPVVSSARRRRTSTPMLLSQSSTPRSRPRSGRRTRRLPRDPVTGKVIRMRQPYSDPRSSSTNRPIRLAAAAAGPRAPSARILNRNIIWNNRGIIPHPSESESEGSESEEIVLRAPHRMTSSNNSNSNSSSELQNLF
jgi:hypothetical protein